MKKARKPFNSHVYLPSHLILLPTNLLLSHTLNFYILILLQLLLDAINDSGSMWWDVEGYKPFSGEWSCPLAWKHTYPDTIFGIKIVTDHGAVHYSEPFHIII